MTNIWKIVCMENSERQRVIEWDCLEPMAKASIYIYVILKPSTSGIKRVMELAGLKLGKVQLEQNA